jgi:hypothetical protein
MAVAFGALMLRPKLDKKQDARTKSKHYQTAVTD